MSSTGSAVGRADGPEPVREPPAGPRIEQSARPGIGRGAAAGYDRTAGPDRTAGSDRTAVSSEPARVTANPARIRGHAPAAAEDEPFPAHARAHLLRTSVNRLNRLRAAVLGGNDGMTSTAGLVVGVAGASSRLGPVLLAGVSGLVAGALSMGGGEYTSVSAQRDSQEALLARQRAELEATPQEELDELAQLYAEKGLSTRLAKEVAAELTTLDALAAHADIELGIDLDDLVSPWQAAGASAAAFLVGGILPILAIVLPSPGARIPVCFVAVALGLAVTGFVAARLGQAAPWRATARNVVVGVVAMLITYAIGSLVGSAL